MAFPTRENRSELICEASGDFPSPEAVEIVEQNSIGDPKKFADPPQRFYYNRETDSKWE
jgi:hypothetical protein